MADGKTDPLVIRRGKHEVMPHYLRASTGSCHDMCKYGMKDAIDEKKRKPLRKKIVKRSSPEHIPIEIVVSSKTKEKLVKHKLATDAKKDSLDLKRSPDVKSCPVKPKTLASKSSSQKLNAPSVDKNTLLKCKPSSSVKKKPLSPDPPEIIKREILLKSPKVEVPLSKGSMTQKLQKSVKRADHQFEKQVSAKLKPRKLELSSSANSDDVDGKGKRNSDSKTGQRTPLYKTSSSRKVVTPAPASLPLKVSRSKKVLARTRKSGTLKSVCPKEKPLTEPKTSCSEEVPEKTLHVIKMEIKDNSLETSPYDHADPSFPSPASPKSFFNVKSPSLSSQGKSNEGEDDGVSNTDEFVSSDEEPTENVKEEPMREDINNTLIKRRVTVAEDKHRSPAKLKFRSGKVVDLELDNNNPRRLKFRKARVAGAGNGKADQNVKTLKKFRHKDDAAGAMISTEKVILKHQDVTGKKDSQGLFNNVIEETASKLVESRKSKVKALVGAFETVISLQEKKPSSSVSESGK